MRQLIWAGLIVQLCAVPGLAQTNPPPAAAPPPTGGPDTPPIAEPANTIERSAVVPDKSVTEAQARSRIEGGGYGNVAGLKKGNDGIWRGTAVKNGSEVHVSVDGDGTVSVN
jgi:hypothetical protein